MRMYILLLDISGHGEEEQDIERGWGEMAASTSMSCRSPTWILWVAGKRTSRASPQIVLIDRGQ
jgi:hypothetical protein